MLHTSFDTFAFGLWALILVALLRHFAEFLKNGYALTLVFSTCSLVADWYSFLKMSISWFAVGCPGGSSSFFHCLFLFRGLLRDCLLYSLNLRSNPLEVILVTHACIISFDSYEMFCYLISYLSFGDHLSHLYFWRVTTWPNALLRVLSLLAGSKPTL